MFLPGGRQKASVDESEADDSCSGCHMWKDTSGLGLMRREEADDESNTKDGPKSSKRALVFYSTGSCQQES